MTQDGPALVLEHTSPRVRSHAPEEILNYIKWFMRVIVQLERLVVTLVSSYLPQIIAASAGLARRDHWSATEHHLHAQDRPQITF